MNEKAFANWTTLRKYVQCLYGEVSRWEAFFLNQTYDWLPHNQVGSWLHNLRQTLRILEELHVYDDLESVSINTESSGFPEIRHLQQIKLLSKYQTEAGQIMTLKQNFLDDLFREGKIQVSLLEKIAKATAYQLQQTGEFLQPFTLTSLRPMSSENGKQAYVCSWERYTSQPLPMKYVMLFEASEKWVPTEESVGILMRVLREDTSITLTMKDIAEDIDRSNALIHPKWLSRIILGPVFISHMTQDDHQLQHTLDRIAVPGDLLCASRLIYEYVVSESEFSVSTVIDPQGIRHSRLQKFGIKKTCEHHDRGVTHLEKHLFAPHRVIQELDSDYRKEIGHQLNSY